MNRLKQRRSLPSKHNNHTVNSLIECLPSINIEFSALRHLIKMLLIKKKKLALLPLMEVKRAVVKHVNPRARMPGPTSLHHLSESCTVLASA